MRRRDRHAALVLALTTTVLVTAAGDPVVPAGTQVVLTSPDPPPGQSVQWQWRDPLITSFINIDGATNPTYSFVASTIDDGQLYRAVAGTTPLTSDIHVTITSDIPLRGDIDGDGKGD